MDDVFLPWSIYHQWTPDPLMSFVRRDGHKRAVDYSLKLKEKSLKFFAVFIQQGAHKATSQVTQTLLDCTEI